MAKSRFPDHSIRNDLGGPLCAEVHRQLNGVYDRDPEAALIALMRSDEPIDTHTRAAIANAIERWREGRTNTLRLRVVRPDGGGQTLFDDFERAYSLQSIADEFQRLRETGLTRQQAIGAIVDSGAAKRTKIEEAIAYSKRTLVRLTKRSD